MKKVLALLLVLISLFTSATVFAADISVKVNGEDVAFDRMPYVENGKVMIPYRFVAEKLGATVVWEAETKIIFTSLNGFVSTMQIGNSKIFAGENSIETDAPSLLIDRTFVTEEAIEFMLSADVSYDEATSTVTVTK